MSVPLAVTQRVVTDPAHGERRLALDVRWPRFLAGCGYLAVAVPLDIALAEETLDRTGCRGLVLTGGNDLGAEPERDALERHLLRRALERELPVLGVCRGMQLILDLFGATLRRVTGHVASAHRLSGAHAGRVVNSFHRWAATEVPEIFDVTACCGPVVEAVVHRTAPLAAVMWHPERAEPFDHRDVDLCTGLFGDGPCVP